MVLKRQYSIPWNSKTVFRAQDFQKVGVKCEVFSEVSIFVKFIIYYYILLYYSYALLKLIKHKLIGVY